MSDDHHPSASTSSLQPKKTDRLLREVDARDGVPRGPGQCSDQAGLSDAGWPFQQHGLVQLKGTHEAQRVSTGGARSQAVVGLLQGDGPQGTCTA